MCSRALNRAEGAGVQAALKDGVVCALNACHASPLHTSHMFGPRLSIYCAEEALAKVLPWMLNWHASRYSGKQCQVFKAATHCHQ